MSNYDESLFVDQEKKFRGFQKLLEPATRQSVMLIEAAQDMGKTWLVGKMQHHCRQREDKVAVATIDFRNPRQIHELQDYLGLIRFVRERLIQNSEESVARHFDNLNATINSFTEEGAGSSRGLATLRQKIELHFNLDELKGIAFDLGVEFENLAGETLRAKSRELVNFCQRRNILPDLVELCAGLRARVEWWEGMETLRRAMAAEGDEGRVAAPVDKYAAIWADSDMERRRAEYQINNAFFECISVLMADVGRVALLFDSYEAAPPEVERWIAEELLPRLRDGLLEQVVVIITGRKTPDLSDADVKHLVVETTLSPFAEEHVREYFEDRRKIDGLDLRTIILTSGGVPGALAMMADHAAIEADDDDDFFSDL
jgi:hypothetical protein